MPESAAPTLHCPQCGSEAVTDVRGGFMEVGEWDGSHYEEELDLSGHQCTQCQFRFWTE